MFSAITDYGVTGRAVRNQLIQLDCVNPRDFTEDVHQTVDDRPFGGGPGMVMKYEPLQMAIHSARSDLSQARVMYLSPQGRQLDSSGIEYLRQQQEIILLAGRYEGIDERLLEKEVDEEWSIGDYVISGGELAAMVLIDAVSRQIPGVLGDAQSAIEDSFFAGLLDCPQYTRPEKLPDGQVVPEVLLSGDHQEIQRWRLKQSLGRTWLRRPDLLEKLELTQEQQALLEEFRQEHIN